MAEANILRYIPINEQTDSEISTSKVYTHTLDFGTGAAAVVNGVQFDQGLTGSLPANFDYQVSSGGLSNHAGHAAGHAAEFKALLSELGIIG